MKRTIILFILQCLNLTVIYAVGKADYHIIPLPKHIELSMKEPPFMLSANTVISCNPKDSILFRNIGFLQQFIKEITHTNLSVRRRKSNCIILRLNHQIINDEAYRITVNKHAVIIEGKTPAGIFYGIQTLRKSLPILATPDSVELPAVTISDEPRFAYRGLLLDCARHFFSVGFIKKYIDLMALHKINTFHWHLTDDQGWRIEIKKYPLLTQIGAKRKETVIGRNTTLYDEQPYGEGYFYTQEEIKEVIAYAKERYITIIPEIDMPGHMVAALSCYPELGCTGGPYEVRTSWGISDDVLCIGNEKVYRFCYDIIDEVSELFPGKYIHTGGDETPTTRWEACGKCQELMKGNQLKVKALQSFFTNRIGRYIASKGKQMIGWDEVLEGDIDNDITIMSWRGTEPGFKAAGQGHDVILTPKMMTYLNYYQTQDIVSEPLLHNRYLPLTNVYNWEPMPDSLTPAARKHILGVQGCLWTEYINANQLAEYQTLPRLAALCEVQWGFPHNRSFKSFLDRLPSLKALYQRLGYQYSSH